MLLGMCVESCSCREFYCVVVVVVVVVGVGVECYGNVLLFCCVGWWDVTWLLLL